ncbi:MAG: AraC family transcriptional regulator [Nevskiales bacterium]|nr:AraC family transcriptional regulator [Nevskiales bacterium]
MTRRAIQARSGAGNSVSVAYLHALFDYLRARNLTVADIASGLDADLNDRDGRVPEALAAELFDRAAAALGDDALGLHAGEQIRPGHYGALGYVAMNSATLGEALDSLRRYQALVIDVGGVDIRRAGDDQILSWDPNTDRPYRQLAEFNISGLVSFTRWLAGPQASPSRVDFAYPAPDDLGEHHRILRCPLRFDQPCYRLALPSAGLHAPVIQPDPAMRELMLRLADKQLLELPRGEDVLARARALIAKRLNHPPVELDWVATQLAMSNRSLQRRLADAGLSFTQLIEQVRRELAERHLRESGLDLTDIAFLLGYSEQSAFQRAFKRWTGLTPSAWRSRHAAVPPAQ